jgi:ClpP class serine protease
MTQVENLRRRALRPGELLAISPDFIQQERGAFFFLFPPPAPKNERVGDVEVVRINGPLEYHDEGECESYERITRRVAMAFKGERDGDSDADDQCGPPKCVVLRIDSPGGVVAGLEQTVNQLRAMSREAGIPLYAYVDEMAYSAAYALCCACSYVALPRSGFCGSIGVISTLVDQTEKDRKDGYRFVVLTSGTRKADGHPHVAITDAMVAAEEPRVETLAQQFFSLVKRARKIPMKVSASFQARRFLGQEAVDAKVADAKQSWRSFLSSLGDMPSSDTRVSPIDSRAKANVAKSVKSVHSSSMANTTDALVAHAATALKEEKDPLKKLALSAVVEAYKKEKHTIEKHEKEEGEDEDDEEDDADEAEESEESESKGDETDRSDDDEDDEDDEDEKSKALVAGIVQSAGIVDKNKRKAFRASLEGAVRGLIADSSASKVFEAAQKITGKKGAKSVVGALQGMAAGVEALKKDVAKIKSDTVASVKKSAIDAALAARRITPAEAKNLHKEPSAHVEFFLKMRPKAIVDAQGSDSPVPDVSGSQLPKDLQAIIAAAQQANPGLKAEDVQADLARVNGAGKRV